MTPNHLSVRWVKHKYCLALEIDQPVVKSVAAIAQFLAEREIQIESITVGAKGFTVQMIIRCHFEKDRLDRTLHLLGLVEGVLKLEVAATT